MTAEARPHPEHEHPHEVAVGLIAAPGLPAGLIPWLLADLTDELGRRFPAVNWRISSVVDPLVTPPADDGEIVEAARRRLLAEDWDLALSITDLPLQVSRRPVIAHASPVHGVGVLCVPALGAVGVRRRALQAAIGLVEGLLGEPDQADDDRSRVGRSRRLRRRASQLGDGTGDSPAPNDWRFTARVLTGNLRLLAGMVRANRPWRLAVRLSRALTAALAAGVFALVTSDIWQLSAAFGGLRLTTVALASVAATAATLILGADLWERAPHRRVRKQVALFNLATTATVVLGVLALYLALFLLAAAAAAVLVVPDLLAGALGHPVGVLDYLRLAWLTSSLATVGGALGAGLESDASIRQAAYAYRFEEPAPQ